VVLCVVDRATYFFFTRCVSALPATEFIAFDDFGSLRIFPALVATGLLVVSFGGFLVAIQFPLREKKTWWSAGETISASMA